MTSRSKRETRKLKQRRGDTVADLVNQNMKLGAALTELRTLVRRAREERPNDRLARFPGSGYVGINYVPVRLPEWRAIVALLETTT